MKPVLILVVLLMVVGGGWYLFGRNPEAPASQASSQSEKVPAAPKVEGTKAAEKAATTTAAAPAAAGGVGSLRGVVKYVGVAPVLPPKAVPPNDQPGCHGATVPDESLIVDPATNGIRWTMIRILDAKPSDAPPKPATAPQMDQKGCVFSPHVLVVPPGTDLEVLNPDGINHNFKTFGLDFVTPERNPLIPASVKKYDYPGKYLPVPEIIEVSCTIHGWMKAYILVHDPRYCAVSGADGKFEIKDLPAGTYQVNVFHEKFGFFQGKETHSVTIKPGAVTDWGELKFEPKK